MLILRIFRALYFNLRPQSPPSKTSKTRSRASEKVLKLNYKKTVYYFHGNPKISQDLLKNQKQNNQALKQGM